MGAQAPFIQLAGYRRIRLWYSHEPFCATPLTDTRQNRAQDCNGTQALTCIWARTCDRMHASDRSTPTNGPTPANSPSGVNRPSRTAGLAHTAGLTCHTGPRQQTGSHVRPRPSCATELTRLPRYPRGPCVHGRERPRARGRAAAHDDRRSPRGRSAAWLQARARTRQ